MTLPNAKYFQIQLTSVETVQAFHKTKKTSVW